MPQVTVYIRRDDMPLWEQIEQKTEFVSRALNERKASVERVNEDRVTTPEKSAKAGLCVKHGTDKSVCKMMKH